MAQSASLESTASLYSDTGGSVTFDVTFDFTGQSLSQLGANIDLPAGWSFASVSGANPPQVQPIAGTTGSAEFAYIAFPSDQISFSVTLDYTAGLTGDQTITGEILYRLNGTSTTEHAAMGPVVLAEASAPAFDTQPQSVSVNLGEPATFTAVVTGVPTPTLQWRKNGEDIAGATGSSYSLAAVGAADAATYTVVATNAVSSTTSSAAELTVIIPPGITSHPTDINVVQGESGSLSVTATGTAPLTYQWRKDGGDVAGATAATLALSNVQTSDAGSYDVVVTNAAGSATSDPAIVTVWVPVTISTQPESQTAVAGTSVSLSVAATGSPAPTYQWRKGGSELNGQTAATLDLGAVALEDAGDYDVVITNAAGSVTSAIATLTVQVPVDISQHPQAQTVAVGAALQLSVSASGFPAPTYQWRKDGQDITDATSATFSIATATLDDAGDYDVVVSNVLGDVTSNAATVTVVSVPVVTTQPVGGIFRLGTPIELSVVASGAAPLSYQWRKDNSELTGATSATLTLASAAFDDAGAYDVVVTNDAGSDTSAVADVVVVELAASHAIAGSGYRPGGTITVNNTITYTGNLGSFGWSVVPPDPVDGQKWSFASSGGTAGEVAPKANDTDLFEWAWTSTPSSPIEFSYTLNVPANAAGIKSLSAMLLARSAGTELMALAAPDPLSLPEAPATHSADTNQDNRIDLAELLRVIELYNYREGTQRTGEYHADGSTTDGFQLGPPPQE